MFSYLTRNEWTVSRRYNEFYDLFLILEKFYLKTPKFPAKSIIKIKNNQDILKRQEELNTFLRVKNFLFFRLYYVDLT